MPDDESLRGPIGAERPASQRQRTGVLLCVAAAHGLLIVALGESMPPRASRDTPARITLRLIAPTPATTPQRAEPIAAAAPQTHARIGPQGPRARVERAPGASAAAPTADLGSAQPSLSVVDRAEPAVAAASQPPPSLMNTEATRRAIRASARAPSLTDEVARATGESPRPANAEERLGSAVRSAGKGDCAKGDYAGAGMGLLSLPFLAAAMARGACAQ